MVSRTQAILHLSFAASRAQLRARIAAACDDGWKKSVIRRIRIRDGLIANTNGNKARVRIADSNATITLKSRRRGPIRTEFEYAIPYSDAAEILSTICDGHVLDKTRHVVTHTAAVWHVDVYEGSREHDQGGGGEPPQTTERVLA